MPTVSTGIPSVGYWTAKLVTTIADTNAPKLATEINAASSVAAECIFGKSWGGPSATYDKVKTERFCTVKPLSLMRWLVRLVTPPGGTVLEPFAGSGTTVEACIIEGFQCIAIEREADYLPLIRQRIDRRRDPVEALRGQAADLGLFDLLGGEGA